jgi:hypothetical protein
MDIILNKESLEELESLLNHIHTDLAMLQDGSWTPDITSIEASLNTVDEIANILGIELKDIRDES